MFAIKANRDRPDFRIFIELLYSSDRNVDTSGNCRHVSDRTWTDVYIKDRESSDPSVTAWVPEEYWEVDENGDDVCTDFIFHVKCADPRIEELFSIYFYLYCGEYIERDGKLLNEADVNNLHQKYAQDIDRVSNSPTHKSSKSNPNPI